MTSESTEAKSPRWPWAVFGLAALWVVLIRIPLILNAESHLDSDLAVDGLTLLEATHGHWRWHYPGTPFMGSGPVLFSWPQAMIWGANPTTLVSGGTIAFLGLVLATFVLGWRAFGAGVACWSLFPLTFSSTGAVWLSGRVTGGHLAAAVWHAGAFALLVPCLRRGWPRDWPALGLWSGFGFSLDPMFGLTLAGLLPAALIGSVVHRRDKGEGKRFLIAFILFTSTFVLGIAPRVIGQACDSYNAYDGQFHFVFDLPLLKSHGRILAEKCLPRLIAGHQIPKLETDPEPSGVNGGPTRLIRPSGVTALSIAVLIVASSALIVGGFGLMASCVFGSTTGRVVVLGLLISAVATLGGFVANHNIFNSDNYRYLVDLLVPWSLGFGIVMHSLVRRTGRWGIVAAVFAICFAGLMTVDLECWYSGFGWVDDHGLPVKKRLDDPSLAWLGGHPEITSITGQYWDVYRLVFLTGERIKGTPLGVYPNRFPEWKPEPDEARAMLTRVTPEGIHFRESAIRDGWKLVYSARGISILVGP